MDTTTRENLINTFGLQGMTQEDQDDVLNEMGGVIFQAAITRIVPELSEDKQKELNNLFDTGAEPDVVMGFIQNAYPNWNQVVTEEALAFRGQMEEEMTKQA